MMAASRNAGIGSPNPKSPNRWWPFSGVKPALQACLYALMCAPNRCGILGCSAAGRLPRRGMLLQCSYTTTPCTLKGDRATSSAKFPHICIHLCDHFVTYWLCVVTQMCCCNRYRSEFPDMYVDEQCILIPDKFAKARHHWLVIARDPGGLLRGTALTSAPVDGQDKQASCRNTSVHIIPESPSICLYVRTCLMRPLAAFVNILCRAGPHRCAAARAHSCAAAYEGRLFNGSTCVIYSFQRCVLVCALL
jgi:hypothetical protein